MAILFAATIAHADIAFQNGFWSATFNCPADANVSSTGGAWPSSCDAATKQLQISPWKNLGCAGTNSQILASSNNSNGGGGRGWKQHGAVSPNTNESDYIIVPLPDPKEVWLRWYFRGQAGRRLSHGKSLYIHTKGSSSSHPYWRLDLSDNDWSISQCSGSDSGGGNGWADATGTNGWDGKWHFVEVHIQTPGNGSVNLEFWIDGKYMDSTSWASGCGATAIDYIEMYTQARASSCNYWEIDDLAAALPTYTGFVKDAQGRKMIGGGGSSSGGGSSGGGSQAVAQPTNLRLLN